MDIMEIINRTFQGIQKLDIQPTEHNVRILGQSMQDLRIIAQVVEQMAKKQAGAEAEEEEEEEEEHEQHDDGANG